MTITLNQVSNNVTTTSIFASNQSIPELKELKPKEMAKLKLTYADQEMRVLISQESKLSKIAQSYNENSAKQTARNQQKVAQPELKKINSNLLYIEEIKQLSDSRSSRRSGSVAESSFQEPYFNNPETNQPSTPGSMPNIDLLGQKTKNDLYSISTLSHTNKNTSGSPSKGIKGDKKFTLRDYLNLNQLSFKKKQTEPLTGRKYTGDTDLESFPALTQKMSSRRRKVQSTTSQLHSSLKDEICKDIRSVQRQLSAMLEMIQMSQVGPGEPCEADLMKIYNISCLLKEKTLKGNDQIIKLMNNCHESNRKVILDL